MKIIFLDFDGPLIPMQSHIQRRALSEKAWPPCVAALNRITDGTGAKIVVSSTWRFAGPEAVAQHLKNWGVTGEVVGITPYQREEQRDGETKVLAAAPRGREIAAWLSEHPNVESFVIIDDDDDMEELSNHLIQTPFEVGLTEVDADKVIGVLEMK
jgi:hypothetical protein